jgi:hypothetical protein
MKNLFHGFFAQLFIAFNAIWLFRLIVSSLWNHQLASTERILYFVVSCLLMVIYFQRITR